MTRRQWMQACGPLLLPPGLSAQGSASRGVRAQPRGRPSGLPFQARFTDVAAAAGLVHPVINGLPEAADYILETVGPGVAFFDYDNDGWLDIFVLNGSRAGGAPAGTTNRLYKNNRDGTFADVTEAAGLVSSGWAQGVTIGDYNNDGFEDIFVTRWGQNTLYRNNGDGTFTDVTARAGLLQEGVHWGSGCTFIDFDRDGHLDLFVANYLEFDFQTIPKPGSKDSCLWKGSPVLCGPRGLTPSRQYLYRNRGDGTFEDVSVKSGIARAKGSYAMTAVAADLDNDGWPDLWVACDSTPSYFFRNNRDGTFREEGLGRGLALSEDGMAQAGMGIAVGDFNLDGSLDLFKTHFADDMHGLYRNDGRGNFEEVTLQAGLGVETRYVGWGAGMVDLDNDGWPDLFMVTGSPFPGIERRVPTHSHRSPRLLFRNLGGGKFEELLDAAGPGLNSPHSSRGCAFGDFDNDGDLDIVIINLNEPPSLLRNDVDGSRHWLKVKLRGVKSNRSAIGARATLAYGGRTQAQEVCAQSSFYSVNDSRLHFGLGAETKAELTIRWPSGLTEKIGAVKVDRLLLIEEGRGIVKEDVFPARR
ncbi:MAG: CRTAC1 family protein [Acidobacteria bacterium]|nr:CRTAC1 family protein [Acidobacteriota bacterium]